MSIACISIKSWGDWVLDNEWKLPAPPVVLDQEEIDFALWKDMVDYPSRYGDDIVDWLDLNEKLEKSSLRWRLGAHWCKKAKEIQDKKECKAAIKIQAAFRGHNTRYRQVWRDCALCLQHTISPMYRNGLWVCKECK